MKMKTKKAYLTKSRYLTGLHCERLLWLNIYDPLPIEDAEVGTPQHTGTYIGEHARSLFKDGVLVEEKPWEHAKALARTQKLMADKKVPAIFEAALEFNNVRIRADVMERLPRNTWALYEVKSTLKPKAGHYEDLAVQAYVIRGNKFKVKKIGIIHINGKYKRGVHGINWTRMFSKTDVTEQVTDIIPEVPDCVFDLQKILRKRREPSTPPGMQCSKDCDYFDHCTVGIPKDWVRFLPRMSPQKFAKLEQIGVNSVRKIPEDFPLTAPQKLIHNVLVSGQDYISPDLYKALKQYSLPTYYLDFETVAPGAPLYRGTSPYEAVAFQWSLHRLDRNGGLKHWEFLANGRTDPRRECAEALIKAIGQTKQPVQMYSTYEKTTLNLLIKACPDLKSELNAIIDRLIDLKKTVSSYTYFRAYQFSNSLKQVAPALSPGFGYGDLDAVADGLAAAGTFERIARGELLETENEADIRNTLLKYCERDTLAMVKVHTALRALI